MEGFTTHHPSQQLEHKTHQRSFRNRQTWQSSPRTPASIFISDIWCPLLDSDQQIIVYIHGPQISHPLGIGHLAIHSPVPPTIPILSSTDTASVSTTPHTLNFKDPGSNFLSFTPQRANPPNHLDPPKLLIAPPAPEFWHSPGILISEHTYLNVKLT